MRMPLGQKKIERAAAPPPAAVPARRSRSPSPRSSRGKKTKWLGLFGGLGSAFHRSKKTPKPHLSFEDGWKILKQGIVTCSEILENPSSRTRISLEQFTDCYNCACALAAHSGQFCQEMYDGYRKELEECVCTLAIPHLMNKRDSQIVEELKNQWTHYSVMVKSICSFLSSLECSYIEPQNLPSLESTAANSFFSQVFSLLKSEVTDAMLLMIRQVRDGNEVDMDSLTGIIDGINHSEVKLSMEQSLVQDAEMYYARKTSKWIAQFSLSEYLIMVQDTMDKESMSLKLLHIEQDSSELILKAVQFILMQDYNDFALPVGLVGNHHPKELSYVGIQNDGATCHMNCVLQVLFHLPYFKKAIREVNHMPSGSLVLALQRLFHQLCYSEKSVSAKVVTNSLGWSPADSLIHQDFEEQCRFLFDKIEEELKGTQIANLINKLFSGCWSEEIWTGGNRVSASPAVFLVVHLEVRGFKGVYSSLDKLVQHERLENYRYNKYGPVVTEQRFLFAKLPPVLFISLKRATFDARQKKIVKVNDRYEFPFILDLDREDGKYLSSEADRNIRNAYTLHSVIAHSGSATYGHYHVIIRPDLSGNWIMFSDSNVTSVTSTITLQELSGGGPNNRSPCACMLVYIRQDDIDEIFVDAQRHPEEGNNLCTKYEAQSSDGAVDLEAQLAKGIFGQQTAITYIEKMYKRIAPIFSVRTFLKYSLRCEMLLQLFGVYSGFHALLLFIDWATEVRLTQEVPKTLARGVAWFSVIVMYLFLLRYIRVKRHYTAEPAPDAVQRYLSMHQIPKPKPKQPATDSTETKEEDIRIVSVSQLKQQENSDIGLAMVFSSAKLLFDTIKDISEENVVRQKDKTGKMNTWLQWRTIAHSSALLVEVLGSYIVRLIFNTEGPPALCETSTW